MNLLHSPQRLAALERFITRDRLTHYLEQCDDDLANAIRLYELNAKLSAIMYGPVQGLEVLLRNAMNEQLIEKFGEDWHNLEAIRLSDKQQRDVHEAVSDLEYDLNDDEDITNSGVVAKLSLGFWAALLNSANDNEVWRKALYLAFPHRPKGTERKAIHGVTNALRRLRNRIAHHEKILHRDLEEDHNRILEMAGWICPETRDWIAAMSEFDPTLLPPADEDEFPLEENVQPEAAMAAPKPPRETKGGRALLGVKK